jgi:FKBP-type peptidyl-prolyl cis-trans isomerase FklB
MPVPVNPKFTLMPAFPRLSTHIRTLVMGSAVVAATIATSEITMAQDAAAPVQDDVGYFLGMSIGQQLSQQGFEPEDFTGAGISQGLADALARKEPNMTGEQMQAVAEKIEATLRARQQAEMEKLKKEGVANLEKSNLFLEQNAKKEGVKQLASGLQYKVLTPGTGKTPTAENTVKVHYTGKLMSGRVFDSSVERGEPAQFGVGQVIPGWRQALQEMKVGDKWMLYIPPNLAYGANGTPDRGPDEGIGPNEALIFEVELLEIVQ